MIKKYKFIQNKLMQQYSSNEKRNKKFCFATVYGSNKKKETTFSFTPNLYIKILLNGQLIALEPWNLIQRQAAWNIFKNLKNNFFQQSNKNILAAQGTDEKPIYQSQNEVNLDSIVHQGPRWCYLNGILALDRELRKYLQNSVLQIIFWKKLLTIKRQKLNKRNKKKKCTGYGQTPLIKEKIRSYLAPQRRAMAKLKYTAKKTSTWLNQEELKQKTKRFAIKANKKIKKLKYISRKAYRLSKRGERKKERCKTKVVFKKTSKKTKKKKLIISSAVKTDKTTQNYDRRQDPGHRFGQFKRPDQRPKEALFASGPRLIAIQSGANSEKTSFIKQSKKKRLFDQLAEFGQIFTFDPISFANNTAAIKSFEYDPERFVKRKKQILPIKKFDLNEFIKGQKKLDEVLKIQRARRYGKNTKK